MERGWRGTQEWEGKEGNAEEGNIKERERKEGNAEERRGNTSEHVPSVVENEKGDGHHLEKDEETVTPSAVQHTTYNM